MVYITRNLTLIEREIPMSEEIEREEQSFQGVTLPVKWQVSETIHNQYVQNVIVQPGSNEITIFLFETHVPPYVGSPEANREYLQSQSIRFECVGKFVVAPQFMPDIIQALETGLNNYYVGKEREEGEKKG
jgi:hypothetical protein